MTTCTTEMASLLQPRYTTYTQGFLWQPSLTIVVTIAVITYISLKRGVCCFLSAWIFFPPVLFCIESLRALVLNQGLLHGSKRVVIGFGTKAGRGGDLGRVYFNVKIWVKFFLLLGSLFFFIFLYKAKIECVSLLFHRSGCVGVAWRTSLALELVISTGNMFHTRFPQESAWQE